MDDKKLTLEEALNRLREIGMGEPDAYLLITVKKGGQCIVTICSDKQRDGMLERCMIVKCMKDLMKDEFASAAALTSYAEDNDLIDSISIKASAANGPENVIEAAEALLNREDDADG